MLTALLPLLILLVLGLVLPLLGAVLGHQPLGQFLHLPLTGRDADALPPDLSIAMTVGALLSLRQWLGSFPTLLRLWSNAAPIPFSGDQQLGWLLIGLGSLGLAGAALWADWIFPLTWTAPLLLAVGFQLIRGVPTLFSGITI